LDIIQIAASGLPWSCIVQENLIPEDTQEDGAKTVLFCFFVY